ncbi:hypothetical protein AA983_06920 [Dermacoccus sp. PE3]|uniref:hypothetical protein n=1 Tax=Dermacoccus sp. PE3 TaxID=1641401 RepID=UPI0006426C27|nr:hypothetical protein [Dermacoccus sp. PE3]KLO63089.1 hypothetical protein AA983_06920 [Dermacoccus sp. PE3]
MSMMITHTSNELLDERRELVGCLKISEAELRAFAASWQLSSEEARVLARLDQIAFLLGDDA